MTIIFSWKCDESSFPAKWLKPLGSIMSRSVLPPPPPSQSPQSFNLLKTPTRWKFCLAPRPECICSASRAGSLQSRELRCQLTCSFVSFRRRNRGRVYLFACVCFESQQLTGPMGEPLRLLRSLIRWLRVIGAYKQRPPLSCSKGPTERKRISRAPLCRIHDSLEVR